MAFLYCDYNCLAHDANPVHACIIETRLCIFRSCGRISLCPRQSLGPDSDHQRVSAHHHWVWPLILLPAWAIKILNGDVTTNGLLLSVHGIGAVLGGLFIAALASRRNRGKCGHPAALLCRSHVRICAFTEPCYFFVLYRPNRFLLCNIGDQQQRPSSI